MFVILCSLMIMPRAVAICQSLLGEGKEFIFARSKHSLLQYDSVRYEERLLYTVVNHLGIILAVLSYYFSRLQVLYSISTVPCVHNTLARKILCSVV